MAQLIRKMGALSFGIYLLHEHIDVRPLWYGWISGIVNPTGVRGIGTFIWELFCCIVLIFAVGMIIDGIRSKLFLGAAAALGQTRAGRKLKELDGFFAIRS